MKSNRYIYSLLCLPFLIGCQVDPIPGDIQQLHELARHDYLVAQPLVQPGDIVFRLGNTKLLGGILDFSEIIADLSDSDFSHACMVLDADEFLIVDVTPFGIERRFFKDWHITGSRNVVVKRLKPQYRHLIPVVLSTVEELIRQDVLYDRKFAENDNRFYCTEVVDHIFRVNGYPLADRIRIKDLPQYGLVHILIAFFGGIDVNEEAVVAGNDKIGLFSSEMLETVVDLRHGIQVPVQETYQLASGSVKETPPTGSPPPPADR